MYASIWPLRLRPLALTIGGPRVGHSWLSRWSNFPIIVLIVPKINLKMAQKGRIKKTQSQNPSARARGGRGGPTLNGKFHFKFPFCFSDYPSLQKCSNVFWFSGNYPFADCDGVVAWGAREIHRRQFFRSSTTVPAVGFSGKSALWLHWGLLKYIEKYFRICC